MLIINKFKILIAHTIAYTTYYVSKLLKIGSGYTWPGHIVLTLFPNILESFSTAFNKGVIVITGTNGKTTTSKLIKHLLTARGYTVLNNETGGNILNGVVSTLLLKSPFVRYDYAVLEVDEFVLPQVLKHLDISYLLLLNLSRDQLDRYGETDIIFDRWLENLGSLALAKESLPTLVYFSEYPLFKKLEEINDNYALLTFDSNTKYLSQSNLVGDFNACNINATFTTLFDIGLSEDFLLKHLKTFEPAWGRGEVLNGYRIFLAKNPTSFNSNLRLVHTLNHEVLLVILNDNIPDGRDISWIYDIDSTLLFEETSKFKKIFFSGTRAYDMAIRFKYAGINIEEDSIIMNLKDCVSKINEVSLDSEVVAFPNYSSMLSLRKILGGSAIL